jgi:hypothetical protein
LKIRKSEGRVRETYPSSTTVKDFDGKNTLRQLFKLDLQILSSFILDFLLAKNDEVLIMHARFVYIIHRNVLLRGSIIIGSGIYVKSLN